MILFSPHILLIITKKDQVIKISTWFSNILKRIDMIWSTKCFYVMYKSGLNKLGPVVNAKAYMEECTMLISSFWITFKSIWRTNLTEFHVSKSVKLNSIRKMFEMFCGLDFQKYELLHYWTLIPKWFSTIFQVTQSDPSYLQYSTSLKIKSGISEHKKVRLRSVIYKELLWTLLSQKASLVTY